MRKYITYFGLAVWVLMSSMACQRRPLYDDTGINNMILDLQIQLEIEDEGVVPSPEVMTVAFADPLNGAVRQVKYTGPAGGPLLVDEGAYDMLVYNFDTRSTHVRKDDNLHTIEAYTNDVQSQDRAEFDAVRSAIKAKAATTRSYLDEPLVYEPDHLFVGRVNDIYIPRYHTAMDDIVIHATAQTTVEVYTIQIGPVQGDEYIAKATVYLTGQVPSVKFGDERTITGEASTIYFPVAVNKDAKEFQGVFHTFGKYPGVDSWVFLIVDITTSGGNRIISEWDVTDQFGGDNDNHIIIETPINIPKPESGAGGFDPVVHDWDSYQTTIIV